MAQTSARSDSPTFCRAKSKDSAFLGYAKRVHPGRDNLVALLRGNPPVEQGGEFLLWDVHQDTVPVDGMTVDPFGGTVQDGKVYGRGASDVKGSMAAMLTAISRVASNERPRVCPTIAIALTVNEECGFSGVESLCKLFRPDEATDASVIAGIISPANMFPRLPDTAIVAEPTEFDVVVAHQGVIRWRCHTIGRAGLTRRVLEAGINAGFMACRESFKRSSGIILIYERMGHCTRASAVRASVSARSMVASP